MKVAIVGLASSTHSDAPWFDDTWEKWGLPWDDKGWPFMARHFEMHDQRLLDSEHSKRGPDYAERLKDCEKLYTQENYPFEAVAKTIGQAYWNSSISYAMALAIHEGAREIAIYGVDMDGTDEYAYQKANMEYLIGLARGQGIDVHIPKQSALCKLTVRHQVL
ncbi:hypothetical protein [Candidatus Aalborgicola defluviihabitans]|uniref:hypothetical protein n=1 Tax=Candidatus Aalborgicola defluviihabitans TaxID=3386187 RepID=UPI001ED70913|nr:hypothetical protein [Burkholderiales bacterium]